MNYENKKTILEKIRVCVYKATLSATHEQKYESFYNLYKCIHENSLYLFINHSSLYHQMEKTGKEIFFDIISKNNKLTNPLKKILLKNHDKYLDNYVNILIYMPCKFPLDIKKTIANFI
tara:strand:+ start:154 stop:510 length:357 start_codon:yes stop_codon:yes gene_type:complete